MNRSLCPSGQAISRLHTYPALTGALVALFMGASLAFSAPANAAIYKCISTSGAVTYSGRKCPEQDTTARIIDDSGIGSVRSRSRTAPTPPAPVRADRDVVGEEEALEAPEELR